MSATPTATASMRALSFMDLPDDLINYIRDLSLVPSVSLNDMVLRARDKVDALYEQRYTVADYMSPREINIQYESNMNTYRLELMDIINNLIASLEPDEYRDLFRGISGKHSHYIYDAFNDTYDMDYVNTGEDRYVMRLVGYGNATYYYEDSDEDDGEYDSADEFEDE